MKLTDIEVDHGARALWSQAGDSRIAYIPWTSRTWCWLSGETVPADMMDDDAWELTDAGLPQRFRDALTRWVNKGTPPGHFLTAVLENDLQGAVGRADSDAWKALRVICQYVWNELPGGCWGSRDKMTTWRKEREQVRSKPPVTGDPVTDNLMRGTAMAMDAIFKATSGGPE